MKERPILFSAPMVRALLAGTKTQTRRIVKPQPSLSPLIGFVWKGSAYGVGSSPAETNRNFAHLLCPYGKPGDRIWVRENGWERPERSARDMREGADTWAPYEYDADGHSDDDRAQFKAWGWKRRPSIHMPRWASRITLEVVAVRVEHLQDITETDAMAEGVEWQDYAGLAKYTARKLYETLWLLINGLESWDANPWVWVVEFKRVP